MTRSYLLGLILILFATALSGCATLELVRPCANLTYSNCPDRCIKRCVGSCDMCQDCEGPGSCIHPNDVDAPYDGPVALMCGVQ